MKASRKSVLALIGAMAMTAAMAAPSVEIVSVQQQYPWTNTVDIVYNVAGVESETNGYFVVFTPTTSTGVAIPDVNGKTSVQVALKGSGVYSTQWFPQTNLQYTACKMTPSVFRGAAKDYMIVDLETWDVYYEPMATQADSNNRYQATEYKTKKLVLRRVPADVYWIGEKDNSAIIGNGYNKYHAVSFDKDYYMGIYELTEAQWNRILLDDKSSSSMRPKASVNWNTVRGSALSSAAPSSGLIYELNRKTNLKGFDLPTSSMWEVAARAGVSAIYQTGDAADSSLQNYAWLVGSPTRDVGTKLPNPWGLYDVNGNVWEWSRDTFNSADLGTLQPNGLIPISSGEASYCAYHSGGWNSRVGTAWVRLSMRHRQTKNYTGGEVGMRLSYIVP